MHALSLRGGFAYPRFTIREPVPPDRHEAEMHKMRQNNENQRGEKRYEKV